MVTPGSPRYSAAHHRLFEPETAPPPPPPEPPSLPRKAANLAAAVVKHVATGLRTVEPAEAERRLAICRACPLLDGNNCKKCGCNMPLKATWADQHCPDGKW